jgi:predicted transglutaminase-like cysteine proteinase
MGDENMYTGVDKPAGQFDNEVKDETTQNKIREQERLIQELTPQLKDINNMLDAEIKLVDSVDHFGDATSHPEEDIRSELRAAFLYKKYLVLLKGKFRNTLKDKR